MQKEFSSSMSEKSHSIAYSCFVDNQPRYIKQSFRFLYSLLRSGKSIENIFFGINQEIDQRYTDILTQQCGLNNISRHATFTSVSKPANKWLQLCDTNLKNFSHVIINDCDKVYIKFDDKWADNAVRACKFVPRPSFKVFEELFDFFDLGHPRFNLDHPDPKDESKDPRNYVNNHNGGLIIIPAHLLESVTGTWKKYIDDLHQNISLLGQNRRNLDQVAFALTMEETGQDINFLPKSLDIGLGVRHLSPWLNTETSGQLILHIHADEDENGLIVTRETTNSDLVALADQFNADYIAWLKTTGAFDYIFDTARAA